MGKNNGKSPELQTKVRLYHVEGKGKADLLGYADLVIDNAFIIKSIRILKVRPECAGGVVSDPFISFPSRKGPAQGEEGPRYFDVAHPITSEAYRAAVDLILDRYRQASVDAQGG